MLVFAAALVAIHPPWDKIAGGLRPARAARAQHQGAADLRLFRRRDHQRGDVPVRGLFLFLGRDRGGVGPQGPADQPRDRRSSAWASARCLRSRSWPARRSCSARPMSTRKFPARAALEAAIPFGKPGLMLALLGMFFAVAGAAVETCMANAYSIAQFFGWDWGRHKKPWEAPRFTLAWIVVFAARAADRAHRRRRDEPGRVCGPLLDPRPAADLSAAACSSRTTRTTCANMRTSGSRRRLGWLYFAIDHAAAIAAHPALSADLGRPGMKPDDPDQARQPAARPAARRQGRALVRSCRRCRAERRRRQGRCGSRRCWSARAPTRAACRRWMYLAGAQDRRRPNRPRSARSRSTTIGSAVQLNCRGREARPAPSRRQGAGMDSRSGARCDAAERSPGHEGQDARRRDARARARSALRERPRRRADLRRRQLHRAADGEEARPPHSVGMRRQGRAQGDRRHARSAAAEG